MRNSLKLLEVVVCTQDRDILPTNHKTSTKVHMDVGHACNTRDLDKTIYFKPKEVNKC